MMNKTPTKPQSCKAPRASETLFPGKLHSMMDFVEQKGLEYIISWVQNGTAIMIHDPKLLVEHVLPYFFGQSKVRSFHRQFYMWRFERVAEGVFKGAFTHPFFLKEHKQLCTLMSRHIDPMNQLSRLQGLIDANNNAASSNSYSNSNNSPINGIMMSQQQQQQQPITKESASSPIIEPLPLNELVPLDAAAHTDRLPTTPSSSLLPGLIPNNSSLVHTTTSLRKQPPSCSSVVTLNKDYGGNLFASTTTTTTTLPQDLLNEKLGCVDATKPAGFSSSLFPLSTTQEENNIDDDDDDGFSIGTIENCEELALVDDIDHPSILTTSNNNDDSSFEQECNLISWG